MSNLLSLEALQTKADGLAAEINAANPDLTFIYIIHNSGQLKSRLQMIEDTLLDHPAGMIARMILKRNFPQTEPSAFQGLAAKQTTYWLGFSTATSLLAIVSINIDEHENYFYALCDLYRQTWHGLEMADLCQDRAVLDKLGNRPMLPKRSPLGEARANLRADTFTCLMLGTEGYQDVIDVVGKKRARQAISRETNDPPHKFPFITVFDATRFAARDILEHLDLDRPRLAKCKDMTEEISAVTTDNQIRQWWRFCEPAQDMAWRGYKPEMILAAALYYSDDPYVRAIAHQIEDISQITAASAEHLNTTFNPFIDLQRNQKIHQHLIDETFELVLAQGVDSESSRPFLDTAARQNHDLLQGRFLGWCAGALQGAARAFDQALTQGRSVSQAAQLEFQMLKSGPTIESLHTLTHEIINRQKTGEIILLEQLPDLSRQFPDLDVVTKSLLQTRDQLKTEKLQEELHAQDLDMVLMPNAPALSLKFGHQVTPTITVEPVTPKPAAAPTFDISPDQMGTPVQKQNIPPPPPPSPATRQKIITLDGDTGLSLEFDEVKDSKS